jgi:2-polyprenyl-6-methoxyphenol hydroxylase-like FAD-dependent oxidoreductase
MSFDFDVCIRGDGITGCAQALALARQGLRVVLVALPNPQGEADVRAYSLNASARQLLASLGAWPEAAATPVQRMAVWGDDGGQIGFDGPAGQPLSWIVDVPPLLDLLRQCVANEAGITLLPSAPQAELTVVCEGKASHSRDAWGLEFQRQPYDQHALAFRVRHERPHGQCARQWFVGHGSQATILALLPLGDPHSSAVVWSLPPPLAQARREQDATLIEPVLMQQTAGELGALSLISGRAVWPLQSAQARHWSGIAPDGSAFVLVGDAAHTIHPLAGLGLNLGLDDVACLAHVLGQRQRQGRLSGVADPRLLREYERQRKLALAVVNAACDGLQTLYAHPSPLARWLRNSGLSCVNRMDFFKRWTMAQATHLDIAT